MKNRSSVLRLLPLGFLVLLFAWSLWPSGVTASYRTYTADYVPDRLADGFDFPVGRGGSAAGYYMARKMTPHHHLGDDWNGTGGGNSDYGDSIYSVADGIVVYSQNYGSNWGQVIIIRHRYKDLDGAIKGVDSLYGHVINRRVLMGDKVRRGQQIAQIGNNDGMYLAHLHLEIRKNTNIGIQAWNFSKGLTNYHRPDQFIAQRRPHLMPRASGGSTFRLASFSKSNPAPAQQSTAKEVVLASQASQAKSSDLKERRLSPRMMLTARYADRSSRTGSSGSGTGLSSVVAKAPESRSASSQQTRSERKPLFAALRSSPSSSDGRTAKSTSKGSSGRTSVKIRVTKAKAPASASSSSPKKNSTPLFASRLSNRKSQPSSSMSSACSATAKRRRFGRQ